MSGIQTMKNNFEVSFNSPQCGWMSIGLSGQSGEFLTTTAHAPHKNALSELMDALAEIARSDRSEFTHTLKWNRDPEEYDFVLDRSGDSATVRVFEFPTGDRDDEHRELVFSHTGDARETAAAFFETFRQLYEERGVDDFIENWHQDFPYRSYENLKRSLSD
jgi:hypothetical protein